MSTLAPGRRPTQVERTLQVVLFSAAALITGGAFALLITMDPEAVRQGGRFFLALGTLVFLGTLETAVVTFARRYWALELGTADQERRCARICLFVVLAAAVLLLGAAVLLPTT